MSHPVPHIWCFHIGIGNIARSELCYLISVMTLLLLYSHQKTFFLSQRAYHFRGNKFRSIASPSNTLSIKVVLLPEISEFRLRKNTAFLLACSFFVFCAPLDFLICSLSPGRTSPVILSDSLQNQGDLFTQLRSGREHSRAVTVASRPFQQQGQAG